MLKVDFREEAVNVALAELLEQRGLSEGRYVANVVDGKVNLYGKQGRRIADEFLLAISVTTGRSLSDDDSAAETPIRLPRKQAPRSQRRAIPAGRDKQQHRVHAQKRSVCGFDACASLKPRFSHAEGTRRPRNQLDDDGVDKRYSSGEPIFPR